MQKNGFMKWSVTVSVENVLKILVGAVISQNGTMRKKYLASQNDEKLKVKKMKSTKLCVRVNNRSKGIIFRRIIRLYYIR